MLHTPRSAISTKAEVIGQGRNFGVPWQKTYSCLTGRAYHCGICPQCRKRRAAFAQAVPMWMSITPPTSNNRVEEKIPCPQIARAPSGPWRTFPMAPLISRK
uniref:7-cyano-7-deazaguanine synthase n=1 Tax=Acidithiobacillus sulfuriphilus TaxID=1867749 RepID=A0A3M8RK60_9PROT|nr:hypothetical protein EC580_02670 [Acidithiobacillus sulfuriphilus]